ncbi:MAG TPA: efflux RND transporter periplasmic adaptor subunit [Bacteroidales bacterium]|nr:efflux RND transporter periplasmic adaptor subunit [Bacteroidales bacterium]
MKRSIIRLGLLAPAILSLMVSCSGNPLDSYKINKGTFHQTVIETGELAAVETKAFILPRYGNYWYQMKIIGILDHGTEVKVGDSIIQLDPTDVKKVIIDLEGQLETEQANMDKLLVNQNNTRAELETNLKNGMASFNLKKLEMEYTKFESNQIRKSKELEFEQEKIALAKVKRSIEFNKTVEKNDLIIQRIRINQIKKNIKSAYEVLPKLTIRTPISGIFQIARNRRNGSVLKIGDQVYQGNNMGNVPNLTKMKVETQINEFDYQKINVGQKVIVRLDAMPDVTFRGEVSLIEKLCYRKDQKSKQKVFDVEVKLLDEDQRLKPGMTVSCEFFCKELKNVVYVPLSCIDTTKTGHCVYLKKGQGYIPVNVKIGPSNNTQIVIYGDFKKGQRLVPVEEIQKD